MVISIEDLKKYITTTEPDAVLEAKLQALELSVRKYTNNNFQKRNIRFQCPIMAQKLHLETNLLNVGDTVQISSSLFNDGIYHITEKEEGFVELNETLIDEPAVIVTMVLYPMDVKMGVVNMLRWELENRDKIGIASETISRHSVTYFNMDADNSALGFPKALTGFLKPYMKPRF